MQQDRHSEQLVETNRVSRIISKMHLLDRGFYTAEVLHTLNSINQPFIMSAKKNSKVMRAIEEYDKGTGKQMLWYTVCGKNAKATVTLVIVPRNDPG